MLYNHGAVKEHDLPLIAIQVSSYLVFRTNMMTGSKGDDHRFIDQSDNRNWCVITDLMTKEKWPLVE